MIERKVTIQAFLGAQEAKVHLLGKLKKLIEGLIRKKD